MSDEEAVEKVEKILAEHGRDIEAVHLAIDDLLFQLLREKGFQKTIELIKTQSLWYA